MSLPTRGDGYAGALYVLVRRFFLIHRSTEMANAIRMMVPKAAPTIAAIGAE
jgi:methylthioribose-1-phosphate isomerase